MARYERVRPAWQSSDEQYQKASAKAQRIVADYTFGWFDSKWDLVRGLLADDVVFECPGRSRVVGVDAHLSLYSEEKRFGPNLNHIQWRGGGGGPSLGFISYLVCRDFHRAVHVIDRVSINGRGKISLVLALEMDMPRDDEDHSC
jgi:hypothetical protein